MSKYKINIMKNKNKKIHSFIVPNWSLSALINCDYSGIFEENKIKIEKFLRKTLNEFKTNDFYIDDPEDIDHFGFMLLNDIDDIGADCYRVYILV